MSSLRDVFDFESLNLKDMWGKIKKDPERVFIGAIDPLSSKMWGEITGKEYDPIINQLGGPQGGGSLGLGENGGVYDKARARGIDTSFSEKSHNAAELISAFFGAMGLGGIGGAGGGAAGGSGAAGTTGGSAAGGAGTAGGVGAGGLEGVTVTAPSFTSGDAGALAAAGAAGGGVANQDMGFGEPSSGGSSWMDNLSSLGQNFSSMGEQQQEATVSQLAMMGPPPNMEMFRAAGPDSDKTNAVLMALQQQLGQRAGVGTGVSPTFTPSGLGDLLGGMA